MGLAFACVSASLFEHFALGELDHDDFLSILAAFFPFAEWHGGDTVIYRTESGEVGLVLLYEGRTLRDVEAGAGLSADRLDELQRRLLLLRRPETEIWRVCSSRR